MEIYCGGGIFLTIILALVGYLFTYFHKLKLQMRQDRLKFIERQISEFYGPLFIITHVSNELFKKYEEKIRGKGLRHLDEDFKEWRIWIENVFMPLNQQLVKTIINNAHLIKEDEIPPCLLDFVTHVADYQAILKKWQMNDFDQTHSFFPFPEKIREYAKKSYLKLKEEQLKLLGNQRH